MTDRALCMRLPNVNEGGLDLTTHVVRLSLNDNLCNPLDLGVVCN